MTTELRRTLTARDVAVITVGTVIGSGIFLTPGGVLRSSGSVGVSMLVWIGGGLLTLLTNWVFQQVWGWPDFGLRYSPGTWREIYGYSTWIASPLVASLAIFFVWPWFVEHETQLLVGKHEGEQG